MINLEKSKKLADLEVELKKLNEEYKTIVKQKIQSEINSFGKQFKDFFEKSGMRVNEVHQTNSSPQKKRFSTETGRIEIELICNHRETELEYFELKWNDEAFTNFRRIIYNKANQRLDGFDIGRTADTDKNIEDTKLNMEVLKDLSEAAPKISFEYFLANENNLQERRQIFSLTEVLKEEFS